MSYTNTTPAQDNEIHAAENHDHIQNLLAIIRDLDDRLTDLIDERVALKEQLTDAINQHNELLDGTELDLPEVDS